MREYGKVISLKRTYFSIVDNECRTELDSTSNAGHHPVLNAAWMVYQSMKLCIRYAMWPANSHAEFLLTAEKGCMFMRLNRIYASCVSEGW